MLTARSLLIKVMRKLFRFKILFLTILVSSSFAYRQSSAQIEKDLVATLNEVQQYSAYGSNYDEDKLSKANDVFEEKLLKYTKIPATLQYKFRQLDGLMMNATSDDGKFLIYTWGTEGGGTMHDFSRIYQYQGTNGKVYSKKAENDADENGSPGSFVTDIFSVDSKDGKVYIISATFIGSTNDNYGSADLYKIEGDTLRDKIKLFKTKSGLTDSISFEYSFFSVVDRKERPIHLILFDKATNTLKIPIVINDKEFPNGRVTNRFISYKFDGNNFVKMS